MTPSNSHVTFFKKNYQYMEYILTIIETKG